MNCFVYYRENSVLIISFCHFFSQFICIYRVFFTSHRFYHIAFLRASFLIVHCVAIVSCFCERACGATVASSVLAVVPLVPCIRFFKLCRVNLLSYLAAAFCKVKVWEASFSKELFLRRFFKCLLFLKCVAKLLLWFCIVCML